MKQIFVILFLFCLLHKLHSQSNNLKKGQINGSYENYSQYYLTDAKISAIPPQDKFGSNNFLKLDYTYDKFTFGIQYESYLPAILGYYPLHVDQSKLVNKYFKYSEDKFSIIVGDFYEQFGSGLIFRSFENRQIGINNALEGVNIFAQPNNFTKLKVVFGKTRNLFAYSNSTTRGLDAEFDLIKAFNKKDEASNTELSFASSFISRYQEYTGPNDQFPATANAFSTRINLGVSNFNMDAEYVQKSKDPQLLNNYSFENGNALLINASFTKNNFGFTLTARALKNMNFGAERNNEFPTLMPVNYLPALTKQHDYLTSNIYVYNTQPNGESGFQTDVFYTLKPGTKLGGKFGTKLSANFSYYGSLNNNKDLLSVGDNKYFSDANIEIKKKWSKKIESTLALQSIFYKASVIRAAAQDDVNANVIAVGVLYKYAPKKSLRIKLEHLSTTTDEGNWASIITEFSFSAPIAFYISDLYNYGTSNIHYYNVGGSYTKDATRFSLAFGKQRPGLFCVGGVCRFVPAAFGFTATLTTTFGN